MIPYPTIPSIGSYVESIFSPLMPKMVELLGDVRKSEDKVINLVLEKLLNREILKEDWLFLTRTITQESLSYELFFKDNRLGVVQHQLGFEQDGTLRYHIHFMPDIKYR
jgi:hypothetical protein